MDTCSVQNQVKLDFIRPGKPAENGFIVTGRLRNECLTASAFFSLHDASEKLQRWSRDYNAARPHAALDGAATAALAYQGFAVRCRTWTL